MIDQNDTTEQQLLKEAQLGIEAQAFLASDLGRYLIAKANNELDAAYEGLLTVTPGDTNTLLTLQSQCHRAINFKRWLVEAINNGLYAELELNNGE